MGHNIRVSRDCEYEQPCKWVKEDGSVVDITNITLTCNVKSYPSRATVNLSPTVTKTSAAAGLFQVDFTKTQTAALVKREYVWEVLATEAGGAISRILSGHLLMVDTGDSLVQPPALQTAVQNLVE